MNRTNNIFFGNKKYPNYSTTSTSHSTKQKQKDSNKLTKSNEVDEFRIEINEDYDALQEKILHYYSYYYFDGRRDFIFSFLGTAQ